MEKINQAIKEKIAQETEKWITETPIRLHIDGIDTELMTVEVERDGGEINLRATLGIKRILLRHPEEYREELHWFLFSEQERQDLLIRRVA